MGSDELNCIPQLYLTFLKDFTDNAPYIDSDIDYNELEELVVKSNGNLTYDKIPINSGTISIVFLSEYKKQKNSNKAIKGRIKKNGRCNS